MIISVRCCRGSFLFTANGWDAPLDSTHPPTVQGLLALDKPNAVGSADLFPPQSLCDSSPLGGAFGGAVKLAVLPKAFPPLGKDSPAPGEVAQHKP